MVREITSQPTFSYHVLTLIVKPLTFSQEYVK